MTYRVNALARGKPLVWYKRLWRWFWGPTVTPHVPPRPEPEFNAKLAKEVADKFIADVPKHPLFEEAMNEFRSLVEDASAQGCYYVAFEPFLDKKGVSERVRVRLRAAFKEEVARMGFIYENASPKDRIWWSRVELCYTHSSVFISRCP